MTAFRVRRFLVGRHISGPARVARTQASATRSGQVAIPRQATQTQHWCWLISRGWPQPPARGEVEKNLSTEDTASQASTSETRTEASATDTYLGVLERLGNGAAFVRRKHASYQPSDEDIYVGQKMVDRFHLKTGDEIWGEAGNPPSSGKSPPLRKVFAVNGRPPESIGHRPKFTRLGAQHPRKQLKLECGLTRRGEVDYTNRIIDLFCPLGMGLR